MRGIFEFISDYGPGIVGAVTIIIFSALIYKERITNIKEEDKDEKE